MLSKNLFLSSAAFFVLVSLPFVGSVGASSEMWSQTYGGTADEKGYSLVATSDGGYALAGDTNPFGPGGFDFLLVKTDTYGNMEWSSTYGGTGWDTAHSLVVTSDGGFALAGTMNAYTTDNSDFWLVKTDEYGIIPEFPSWIIIPLFLTATLAAIFYSKRVRARLRHF